MELEEKANRDGKATNAETEKINDFDDILEVVGSNGKYQKILLYGMLTPLCILCPYFFANKIFMLSVPDHWCHIPGRPNSTDLEAWKNVTLPMETGPDGYPRLSQCEIFSLDGPNLTKVKCDTWEYDTSKYDLTLPSEYNWVCEKEYYVANVFSISGAGQTVGGIALGIAVDKFGRKSTYFSTLFCFTFFSLTSLFVPSSITTFLVLQFLCGIASCLIYVSPSMIAMELMGKEQRAWVYSLTSMAFVLGNAFLPLFAYLLRSWFLIGLMTPVTAIFMFVYYKLLPESPRWLLTMGRMDEALRIVEEVAKVNGKSIHKEELTQAFKAISVKNEISAKDTRIWDLFSRKSLATRTILLGIASSANGLVFGGLLLNVTSMAGNEFLNYFLLGIVELPVGLAAGYLADRFGRRWTKTVLFLLTAFVFIIAAIFIASHSWVVVVAAMTGNFLLTTNTIVGGLHESELFPTQLRSTGSSLVATVAAVIGLSVPYIVQLGKSYATVPYMIFTAVSLVGAVTSPLLPETLGRKLPDTVEDAENFGRGHKFWSFLPKVEP